MLDKNILDQVKGVFASLKSQITFAATSKKDDEKKRGIARISQRYSFNIRKIVG